jgi:quercetin dioxygenase-like cupin family protein
MVRAYSFAGTTMTVLVPGDLSGGAFTALHVIKPHGCSTPPHSHAAETELCYVLSGSLGVETEGRGITVGEGDCIVLPPTRPHRLFNGSGADVREFLLCAPAMFDRFVAAAGTPVAPYAKPRGMTDEDRGRLVAAAPGFGIHLLPSAAPQSVAHGAATSSSETLDMPDPRFDVRAKLGSADTDLVLVRRSISPGLSLTLQSHLDPGCLFVIDGELEVCLEDEPGGCKRLGPDEAIYFGPDTSRPDMSYTVRVPGAGPVSFLIVATARMVRSVVSSTAAGTSAPGAER